MLVIEHLYKHYKGTDKGVSDISLTVESGDIYAFIGHNGAGKTTLLKAVAGIHDFNQGTVLIDGIDLTQDPLEAKRRMSYIPDNPDIYEFLTGIQFLQFVADVYGVPPEARRRRIADLSERLEIAEELGNLISSYSHGMKQKLVIISALLHEPRLLVMDEPFVGLDPKAAFNLKELMRQTTAGSGAIFFSTHVLEVAEKLCNKVAIIKDGRIIADGPMEEVVAAGETLEDLFLEVV